MRLKYTSNRVICLFKDMTPGKYTFVEEKERRLQDMCVSCELVSFTVYRDNHINANIICNGCKYSWSYTSNKFNNQLMQRVK